MRRYAFQMLDGELRIFYDDESANDFREKNKKYIEGCSVSEPLSEEGIRQWKEGQEAKEKARQEYIKMRKGLVS